MKILVTNTDLNEALNGLSNIGFVPTMGSLHKGHISLIKRSLKECDKTIVSIFVNPIQFNSKKDYKNYPRNNKKDLQLLKKLKVNFVFLPKESVIYKTKKKSQIKINKKDRILCAKFRKGHFEGVLDVMNRFTKLIKPKKIFMGEKDFQQLYLTKRYIEKKYDAKVVSCKTIRDNKLALSSRNLLLTRKYLNKAKAVSKNLIIFKKKLILRKNVRHLVYQKKIELSKLFDIKIEYLELRKKRNLKISENFKGSKLFISYYLNKIRLIDNF